MSDFNPEAFRGCVRRCGLVFAAVVCATLLMVAASFAPIDNRSLVIGIVLAGACINASLVAGYLMHLVSERRTIIALLAFTAVFFAGLMGLTAFSLYDVPALIKH